MLVAGLAAIGVSAACIINANSTRIADLFREQLRRVMSLTSALWFSASAIAAPLIGAWLQLAQKHNFSQWGYRISYVWDLLLIGTCLFLVIRFFRGEKSDQPQPTELKIDRPRERSIVKPDRKNSLIWVLVLGAFHGLMIVTIMAWMNPMVQEKFGVTEFEGALAYGVTALGLGAGRFTLAVLTLRRLDDRVLLALSSFAGGVVFLLSLLAPSYSSTLLAFAVGGFVCSGTLPCILSIIGTRFPQIKAKVYGYTATSISSGGQIGPPLIGFMADHGVPIWTAASIGSIAAGMMAITSLIWRIRQPPTRL